MLERSERCDLCQWMDARLDSIRMTPSTRREARHAMELGAQIAVLMLTTTHGFKRLYRAATAQPATKEDAGGGTESAARAKPRAADALR